jgi:hypothetical protein
MNGMHRAEAYCQQHPFFPFAAAAGWACQLEPGERDITLMQSEIVLHYIQPSRRASLPMCRTESRGFPNIASLSKNAFLPLGSGPSADGGARRPP